jgi:acetyl-CoA carboxylase carboxyltransferase component
MAFTNEEKRTYLESLNEKAMLGGGEARIAKQHDQGKYTARERIDRLLDLGTFHEFDKFVTHQNTSFGMEKTKFLGDGVITGIGDYQRTKSSCLFSRLYLLGWSAWNGLR